MPHQIAIKPSNHVFTVNDDETILEAALREGFVIAYGCRNGACGTCKGKVLEGLVDYGKYQEHALADTEKKLGMALFCQARPLTDLAIECREIGAVKDIQIRTLPCRVQKMERIAPDVMMLYLRLPANERLQFLAGQYIDILMKDGGRRSLSMANPPHDDTFLQLHLRNYGGPFSDYVFNRMKDKEILRFEGPLGTFFLREDSNKPIVLLASGTGFAPIKAIVEHEIHKGIKRPTTLYWGGRVRADLYMNELAEKWQREDGIGYVPVLSEARLEDNWRGRAGLVHRAVMEDFPDLSGHQVYACGAPVMVEAAHQDFTTRCKLSDEEFFSDSFTPAVPESN
ncbi:MAG: CDP-6-deoxy-delta-3,4-glucoseen reductase [Betaproteobacteria bacterium RIFCSPLOWO2_12_FULL_62_58]|nr:MAG: CDP-6-deoxy-delta-3,4-glucoseen reductase [Betaproteobacteria bacterium RIFCSPLOWO2_12_FULL_62_58]